MNPVAGYVVKQEAASGSADNAFPTAEEAVDRARYMAMKYGEPYYVCKLVPTHFIKPPVPRPEAAVVEEVPDVVAQ